MLQSVCVQGAMPLTTWSLISSLLATSTALLKSLGSEVETMRLSAGQRPFTKCSLSLGLLGVPLAFRCMHGKLVAESPFQNPLLIPLFPVFVNKDQHS